MRQPGLTAGRADFSAPGRAIGWALAGVLVVTAVAAAEYWRGSPVAEAPAPLDPESLVAGYGPATFAEALAAADANVSAKRYLLQGEAGSWIRMEGLARALLARARLTASAEDLLEANRLLDAGLAASDWPTGPTLSRAGAALMIHDLPGVESALARFDAGAVQGTGLEIAEAQGMRCEVAFERGNLGEAQRLCAENGTLGLDLRRANMALASGDPARAAGIVEQALREPRQTPFQLATLMLQRAAIALAAGDWTTVGEWARAADRRFPGYWLAQAFVAQSLALEGDTRGAEAAYGAIARRTGNPDVYRALIVLAEARGDERARQEYIAEAGKGWDRRVALLPETYAVHYAEYLVLYGDRREGLVRAEADYRRRPFPSTISHYAFALWRSGEANRALAVARQGESHGFLTADIKLAEAVSLAALGQADEAGKAMAEARRINPRIDDPRQQFVSFQQD